MHIHIGHSTVYRYDPPATGVIQLLRLTPRDHEGQHVTRWRIDVSPDTRLKAHEDAFGNITHVFNTVGTFAELRIDIEGEVETQDTHGVIRGAVERFPPDLFLRETPLTAPDQAIRDFANEVRATRGGDALKQAHAILEWLHKEMTFDLSMTDLLPTASEAFALKRGVCRDQCHIFLAAARHLGIPARYVAGYLHMADGTVEQEAGHAWAEAFIADVGWVGFDPANAICPTEAYIRVAIGLDSIGAAPVRGMRFGAGRENLDVTITVGQ
jgi:transglutaminase-like putative cysteine protease